MAAFVGLKDDTHFLRDVFPLGRGRFRVASANVDEISCQFFTDEETASPAIELTVAFGVGDAELEAKQLVTDII
jgi:hypothetical protein